MTTHSKDTGVIDMKVIRSKFFYALFRTEKNLSKSNNFGYVFLFQRRPFPTNRKTVQTLRAGASARSSHTCIIRRFRD